MAPIERKGTLADVSAHLRNVVLALVLSGCGFSGALYLPEEPQAAPEEQSSPPPPLAPKQPRPAPEQPPLPGGGDPPEGPPA